MEVFQYIPLIISKINMAFCSKYLNQLLVWEWKSESYIYKQQGHMNDINLIAFSPEGAQLASGC